MSNNRESESNIKPSLDPIKPSLERVKPSLEQVDPHELPPVTPPSAGFMIQLFVVPGLIVLVVVGVWALFGQISSSEQDWRTLLTTMRSKNEQRRWRAATSLAQLILADQSTGRKNTKLTQNRQIAEELSKMLLEQFKKTSPSEEDLNVQQFLVGALGALDVPDVIIPVLCDAAGAERDDVVRRNAIWSIAGVKHRSNVRQQPIEDSSVVDVMIEVSNDDDNAIRQITTYTIGFFDSEKAHQRLQVLLEDSDSITRVNAAVGLARHKSTDGYHVFCSILSQPVPEKRDDVELDDNEFMAIFLGLKNTIKAVDDLANEWTSQQRDELAKLLKPITAEHFDPKMRIDASAATTKLSLLLE